jgi:SAM-dependent methyltransferase
MSQSESDLQRAAKYGEPSYVWRAGQERRWRMICDAVGERMAGYVLDNGCGVGAYLKPISDLTPNVIGLEFDRTRALAAREISPATIQGAGENLPLPSAKFDVVVSMEVLEHVEDDRKALEEIVRVLTKAGNFGRGRLVLFIPNRGYPFETHGVFWHGSYRFGNIPLVNYLPRRWRDKLAPHVRVYGSNDVNRLLEGLPLKVVERTIIFGAYDNIIARWPRFGRVMRGILQGLERTPFNLFGLSHFLVLERE